MSSQDDSLSKVTKDSKSPTRPALPLLSRKTFEKPKRTYALKSFDRELLLRIIRDRFSATGTDRA